MSTKSVLGNTALNMQTLQQEIKSPSKLGYFSKATEQTGTILPQEESKVPPQISLALFLIMV